MPIEVRVLPEYIFIKYIDFQAQNIINDLLNLVIVKIIKKLAKSGHIDT
jgi:hypothetical protein